MPHSARDRRLLLLAIVMVAALPRIRAQQLQVSWTGGELKVSAPQLHFLAGKALDRLRDGNTVTFDVQLSLTFGPALIRRSAERFVISYDLWEERFSVTRLARDRGERRGSSHLTQNAAESYVLSNVTLAASNLDPNQQATVQLEVRAEERRDAAEPDNGLSLAALIEAFSRPARTQQQRWVLRHGPFRLGEVRKGS